MDDDRSHDSNHDPSVDSSVDPSVDPGQDALDAAAAAIDPALLDGLAGQLVWRIGRAAEDAPVTVRVGLASAAPAFAELPRLRNATDAELRDAIDAGDVRVEWVGTKGR